MVVNLLESLQFKLGYPTLQKIDPNTQLVTENANAPDEHKFSQAAIPVVLTSLYNYSQTDVGALKVLQASALTTWTNYIFSDNQQMVVERIAAYANYTTDNVISKLHSITVAAVIIIKEQLPVDATIHDVKKYMNAQRNNILPFLPADLQLGELLHDNTLDDSTNKMQGPISSIIRSIGGSFSNGEVEPDNVVR